MIDEIRRARGPDYLLFWLAHAYVNPLDEEEENAVATKTLEEMRQLPDFMVDTWPS